VFAFEVTYGELSNKRSRHGVRDGRTAHDFIILAQGKATPYGIYDVHRNEGWVSGIDHGTASFAVHAIRRGWRVMGRAAYPDADRLLITADAGGSNGTTLRLWK
jgi:hypothetical protein